MKNDPNEQNGIMNNDPYYQTTKHLNKQAHTLSNKTIMKCLQPKTATFHPYPINKQCHHKLFLSIQCKSDRLLNHAIIRPYRRETGETNPELSRINW